MHRWLLSLALALPLSGTAFAQPSGDEDDTGTGAVPDNESDDGESAIPAPDDAPPAEGVVTAAPPKIENATVEEPGAAAPTFQSDKIEEPAPKVYVSDFTDVRLNITLTNENLFVKPGETIPSVPGWRFGVPNSLGTLFFDNYDTRYSGYETLSHAVLYRQHNYRNWEAEGALVFRFNDIAENKIDLSDAGSYIRVAHWKDPSRQDPTRISLVAFPTSSDRVRLGYSYRLSWGGSPEYRRSRSAVPGIKLQYDTGNMYAYAGAKSAIVLNQDTNEEEGVMGFLGGAGIDLTPMVRVEFNGGYFDRGSNELQDVLKEKVQLYGVSAQVALHDGMPVGTSIDYRLYRNDPERIMRLFQRVQYPGGLSWLVSSEATRLFQTLKDPEKTGSTTVQQAMAADLNGRVKYNRTRLRLDVQYRDLAYILHSTPSLPTYSDFPEDYDQTANFFVAAGADQNFNDQWTFGLVLGLELPATLTTPTGVIPGDTVEGDGRSTAVIRDANHISILPVGEKAAAQLAAKLTARLDFADYFASILDVYYSYDPNFTRLTRDGPEDLERYVFGEFNQLGINLALQAKF